MAIFTNALLLAATSLGLGATGISVFVGVGMFALKTAAGIALNLIAQAIAGKPKDPTFSINGTLQSGGDIPRSFILGRTATAGSLVWANTWGNSGDTPNAFLTQVIALSDLPVTGLVEVWVNGELCTLLTDEEHADRGYPVSEYRKSGKDYLWIKFHDGTQTVADEFLRTKAASSARPWESTRIGTGVAYAIATALVTKNLFSGIPSFKFVLDGCPLYDISKDTTAGGDGAHRWDDPTTWGGDGDGFPAVQAYYLLRGLTYGAKWFYGLQGLSSARLPAANWIAQIGKCRAGITGAGGAEPTYRSAGEIQIDAPLATAIEAINTTCQGRIAETGGVYSMFLGAPDEPSFSFSDGDILSSDEQSFTPFFGLADTINGIFATYPSPADGWTAKTAPPLYRTDLEAQHGNRRLMADVALDFVPYAEQVQRLMSSALLEGQRARRHTLVLPPEFWAYAVPGAICTWTSTRNGYEAKLFRVDGVADRANLDVMIDITEVDPDDYDWDTETDYSPPVDGALGPIRPAPQPIVDWFAEPASVKDNDGVARRPAILLTWDNDEGRLDDVIGVEFEVRLASSLETVHQGRTDQPEAGSLLVSQGLLNNTLYGVRGRYIPGSDRDVTWSNWLNVTTPDIKITDVEVYLGAVGDDVRDLLVSVHRDMDELRARMELIAAGSAEATGASVSQHSVARRFQDATAVVLQEQSASIDVIDGELVAHAAVLTGLEASVGDVSSGILWRMTTEAGTGDVTARVVLQVRATTGDDWVTAGTIWEAGFTGGDPLQPFARIVMNADQFVVTDGTVENLPLVYEAGVLKLNGVVVNWADIADVVVGTAQIEDAAITTAKIGSLFVIGTSNLDFDSVTDSDQMGDGVTDGSGNTGGSWQDIESITIDNPNPNPVFWEIFGDVVAEFVLNTGSISAKIRIINTTNGNAVVYESDTVGRGSPGSSTLSLNGVFKLDRNVLQGSNTYKLQIFGDNSGSALGNVHFRNYECKMLWWKR